MHYYFADSIEAAVIMTADDELYVQFKPTGSDEVAFIDLLIRMTGVHIKARHVLQKEDYRTIMETVFVVISYCMSSLDHQRSSHDQPEAGKRAERERADALEFLHRESARVEQDLDNIIHRRAERTYFNGMLGAVLALGLAGVLLANLLDQSGNFDNYKYLLVAGLAGSIGATISVMWRITFGRFSPSNAIIAFQQGKKASVTLAIFGSGAALHRHCLRDHRLRARPGRGCPSSLRGSAPTPSTSTQRSRSSPGSASAGRRAPSRTRSAVSAQCTHHRAPEPSRTSQPHASPAIAADCVLWSGENEGVVEPR